MFEKLFNWVKKEAQPEADIPQPKIQFGRYSDNNKTKAKAQFWTDADNLYKDKKYKESISTFFKYLADDEAQNVELKDEPNGTSFILNQGSKVLRGTINDTTLKAEINLAKMEQPGVAIMRRLLDQNFNLYYSRYALNNDMLCMRFDSDVNAASPSKLYYGLKELAIKADKQDDLLVQDFPQLKTIDTDHIVPLSEQEKQVKYDYLQKFIAEVLDRIASVDADKFSGGIAYLLLTLVYRIDFLIAPEGKLLQEIEAIYAIYWDADKGTIIEKNRDMIEGFKKIQQKPKEEIFPYLFQSKSTFSVNAPTLYKNVADSLHKALDGSAWYKTNEYPLWANHIIEYGLAYCQYSFSLPKPLTDLYLLYMQINNPDYFTALGFKLTYNNGGLNNEAITKRIMHIQNHWKEKHTKLDFKTEKLNFTNLTEFNFSFCNEIEFLNFDI
jgi:hypothetical protein